MIPQEFIEEVLERTDIVEIIEPRVTLKKTGQNYSGLCPFHEEKSPSFSVSQDKQFYYCFGCQASGSALKFLMEFDRMDFVSSIEHLAQRAGLEVPQDQKSDLGASQKRKSIYEVLDQSTTFFREQLKIHESRDRAVDYLKGRGLSGEIARDFGVGYAPPGWDNLMSKLSVTNADRQLLIDSGMLTENTDEDKTYDRFRDRIMFPIRDLRGRTIAFGGRVLEDDAKPKYLNSPETDVFHKGRELYGLFEARKRVRKLNKLIVVEGYMDVVALAQHGINWSAATLGTATSTDHLNRVFRQCPEVIFCFDGDEAGRKAAVRALDSALPAMEDGRRARFLFLPQGEDPDSMVRAIGASNFIRLIEKAEPLEEYLFNAQADGLDLGSLDGRARMSTLAAPLIDKLPDGVFKELMMSSLADRTGLSLEKLSEILQRHKRNKQAAEPQPASPQLPDQAPLNTPASPKRRDKGLVKSETMRDPILYAIALLLHDPKAASHVTIPATLLQSDDGNAPLLIAMLELLHKRPDSTSAMLIGHWYGESWGETLQQLLHAEQFIPSTDIELELIDTLQHLDRRHQHQDLGHQLDKILSKDYASLSDEEKLQLKQLLQQKHGL